MKPLYFFLLLFIIPLNLFSETESRLSIDPSDIRITQSLEGGYYVYIRQLPGMESVLLTESTVASDAQTANYALRNPHYHPTNGDEKRLLDGEFIEPSRGYPIISSTAKDHPSFGKAFELYIPYIVDFGYPWTRNGELQVLDGTFLNIRAFEKPYADYTGSFQENPFVLKLFKDLKKVHL